MTEMKGADDHDDEEASSDDGGDDGTASSIPSVLVLSIGAVYPLILSLHNAPYIVLSGRHMSKMDKHAVTRPRFYPVV